MPLGGATRWLVRGGISAAIVAYILRHVDLGDVARAVSAVRLLPLAAALALYLAGQGLSAVKWWLLGCSVGLERPLASYARYYFIGMFFNLFGPSTLGGDVVRGLYLGGGRRPGLALNSVLFDRGSGLALLMALGAVALIASPRYDLPWPLTAGIGGGGAALVIGWWTCPRLVRLLPAGTRIRRQVEDELGPFWGDRRLLLRVSVVSLVFHLSQVAVQYCLALAAGVRLDFAYCLIFHPVISVMTALPVSIGGFGVREGGYLYFLTRIGVDDGVAVTVALLWFTLTVVTGLVGAALFVAGGGELPKVREARRAEVRAPRSAARTGS